MAHPHGKRKAKDTLMATITLKIKTIDGAIHNVTNSDSWENFLLGLKLMGAFVAPIGVYIPLDKIIWIARADVPVEMQPTYEPVPKTEVN